jgi:FixJ family two-component response regulator
MKPDTIFIVDDDPLVRQMLAWMLRESGFFVKTFDSGREFLDHLPFEGTCCAVIDLQMPGMSGLDLQRELARSEVPISLIFMTGHGDIPASVNAMKNGAVDFLLKPFENKTLLAAIQTALEKNRANQMKHAERQAVQALERSLTPREREVMARVVAGQINKHIALGLGITEATVKVHRGRVMRKMGVTSVAELVKAVERGKR